MLTESHIRWLVDWQPEDLWLYAPDVWPDPETEAMYVSWLVRVHDEAADTRYLVELYALWSEESLTLHPGLQGLTIEDYYCLCNGRFDRRLAEMRLRDDPQLCYLDPSACTMCGGLGTFPGYLGGCPGCRAQGGYLLIRKPGVPTHLKCGCCGANRPESEMAVCERFPEAPHPVCMDCETVGCAGAGCDRRICRRCRDGGARLCIWCRDREIEARAERDYEDALERRRKYA